MEGKTRRWGRGGGRLPSLPSWLMRFDDSLGPWKNEA